MGKTTAIVLALLAGVIAITAPILAAIQVAKRQSLAEEIEQVTALATDLLRRSDETARQGLEGIERLSRANAADPCSDANIAIMRDIDIGSSYLQTIGHIAGNRLMCSSLGRHGEGLELGLIDMVSEHGITIRKAVELPIAPGRKFLVASNDTYAIVVHHDLALDVFTDKRDTSVAIFSYSNGVPLVSRGTFKPDWVGAMLVERESAFFDGEYVVAVLRSSRYDTAAIAAVPARYLDQRVRGFALVMVPLGLAVGLALVLALVYLAKQQLSLPAVLRVALRRREFFLLYQPLVNLQTREWIGAEALIRWRRADGSLMRPDLFIPAAEDAGLIQRITERVIEIVGQDAWDLFRQHPHAHIGINLSAVDLQSERTVELLGKLARETRAGPRNLVVEATERGFMNADVAREIVRKLRAMGVTVAIDDFGTGYSSLAYLATFELDYLKIDKSFVDTVGTDAPTSQVALHIIEMAKSLKLEMIAEGVETEAQAQFLRERGVQYAQGWLFGKPMPFEEFVRGMPKK